MPEPDNSTSPQQPEPANARAWRRLPAGIGSRFYPIVDSAEALVELLPSGIRFVQLRSKLPAGVALTSQIERARTACLAAGCQLVVNDHWREAIETGCQYLHLGQEDLNDADLPAIRRAGIQVGISTHDQHELDRALECQADAIALGPIFPTTSKTLHWQAQGLTRLSHWRRQIGARPLIAIGGITLDSAPLVLDAGADTIAVIGDVANHSKPVVRCEQWLTAVGQN